MLLSYNLRVLLCKIPEFISFHSIPKLESSVKGCMCVCVCVLRNALAKSRVIEKDLTEHRTGVCEAYEWLEAVGLQLHNAT